MHHTKEKGITLHLYPRPHIIPPTKVAFVESLDCSMSWQNVIVVFMHALTKTCHQVKKMASLLHLCLLSTIFTVASVITKCHSTEKCLLWRRPRYNKLQITNYLVNGKNICYSGVI